MQALVPGDTVVVSKLDRLARSTRDLHNILHELQERGCGFVSLGESWCDTTSEVGRLMLTIMGGVAEFERGLIRNRCEEGIERAKAKGTKFGRPTALDHGQRSASPSVTLPARQWPSWRVSTSAARRRFGGRCNNSWAYLPFFRGLIAGTPMSGLLQPCGVGRRTGYVAFKIRPQPADRRLPTPGKISDLRFSHCAFRAVLVHCSS